MERFLQLNNYALMAIEDRMEYMSAGQVAFMPHRVIWMADASAGVNPMTDIEWGPIHTVAQLDDGTQVFLKETLDELRTRINELYDAE